MVSFPLKKVTFAALVSFKIWSLFVYMIRKEACRACITRADCPSPHTNFNWIPVLGMVSALLLTACGSVNMRDSPASGSAEEIPMSPVSSISAVDRAIAADMLRTALQIYTPFNTTLQMSKSDDDPLLSHFIQEFANSGYGIQRVSADQGSNFFSFTRTEEDSDDGQPLIRFDSSIGAVDMGRDYFVPDDKTVVPASPVRLSGTRIAVNVPDESDDTFKALNPANSRAVYVASMNLAEQAPPLISLITDEVVDQVATQSTQSTQPAASLQGLNSSRVEINNLFYADQSNFSSILDDYQQIERQIVVFGNDSMVLGNTNKLLIEQFVQQRVNTDDLISLVGCSNGPTVLDIGNEGLALGRAERVTQALLSQGIGRDRILDEGCWAPVSAGDKFPSRGVVLELWRRLS